MCLELEAGDRVASIHSVAEKRNSRKPVNSRSATYTLGPGHSQLVQRVADKLNSRKRSFRLGEFSETELPVNKILGNSVGIKRAGAV